MNMPDVARDDLRWRGLYKIGGWASVIMLVIIPIQAARYMVFPPPNSVLGYFTLFQSNWFVGLLDLDLLLVIDNILLILIYLPLYAALKRTNESLMTLGLALGLIGIAAYFPSNTGFEMLSLSRQYAAASTEAQRTVLLGAGQAMLAIYAGTAFNIYYVFNAVVLLIFSFVMLRSDTFSRTHAYFGLAAGVLMSVPSTAGMVGIIFSMLSLVPWVVWLVLFARRLFQLGRGA